MIETEKVIEGLEKAKEIIDLWIPLFEQHNTTPFIEEAIIMLKNKQKIVRCKDCKWRFDLHCPMFDGETDHVPDINWFCGDGERKEGDSG